MSRIPSISLPTCDDSPSHASDNPAILASRIRAHIKVMKKCREMLVRLGREVEELQRKHDSFAPISSCPPEIFGIIFEIYVVNHWTEYDSTLITKPHSWLTILHVCRTWRVLILSMPQLWTRITPTSPDFVRFAVSHAGNLPLAVKAFRYPGSIKLVPESMFPNGMFRTHRVIWWLLPRLRHADVSLTLDAYLDLQTQMSSTQHVVAAELEELHLACLVQYSAPPTASSIQLPVVHCPKLAILRFTCITDSGSILRALVRSTLTTLILSANYPTMQPLVMAKLLQQLPLLRTLEVTHFLLYEESTYPFAATRTADLAHLRNISLTELNTAGSPSIHLLYHLAIPSIENLQLYMVDRLTEEQREILLSALFQRLAPHIGSAYPPLACAHVMTVEACESQDVNPFQIQLWSCQRHPGSSSLHLEDRKTTLTVGINSLASNTVSSSLLNRLNKRDLLVLDVRARLDRQGWVRTFADSTKVEDLFIEDCETAYEFLAALSEPLPEDMDPETKPDEPRPPRYLFPNLRELELFSVRWRKDRGKAQNGDFLPHALLCLERRMQRGIGPKLLKVTHAFNLTQEEAGLLHDSGVDIEIKHYYGGGVD